MGDIKGFMKHDRSLPKYQKANERVQHFDEFYIKEEESHKIEQSSRCMDCGIPFCHSGCPLGNRIPEFNNAVHKEEWKLAFDILESTNNFPEFTGRICPAPCEGSCVLGINNEAVAIEYIEKSIAEKAFEQEWVQPRKPDLESGKSVAVVGSGPSGLASADELRAKGHQVTVYERADRIGGLLRYGIPDFKLSKKVVDRRLALMEEAGIVFKTGQNLGQNITLEQLQNDHDSVVLCIGSTKPRDLNIEGRELKGVHYAMDFLTQVNKQVAGGDKATIDCKDKKVLVIGGGDTGSDCIGSSNRLGATKVVQLELLSKPSNVRKEDNPWPLWPMVLRTSSSHEEGAERQWAVATKRFLTQDGVNLSGVETVKVTWEKDANGKYQLSEDPKSKDIIACDLAFLAIGFVNPELAGTLSKAGLELDNRKNINSTNYKTNINNVFTAGDARMGQSLVVHAIAEGRKAAAVVHEHLMKEHKTFVRDGHPFGL